MDFRSAFDRVWGRKLLCKLQALGFKGPLYRAITSFLAQRFIRVRCNESVSSYRQGLPQRLVISPVLFNLMIDDVITAVQKPVQALLYANFLVFWATSSKIITLEAAIKEPLNRLLNWANENEMVFNPDKSEFQLFTLSTNLLNRL